jgi:hypothetical protein
MKKDYMVNTMRGETEEEMEREERGTGSFIQTPST